MWTCTYAYPLSPECMASLNAASLLISMTRIKPIIALQSFEIDFFTNSTYPGSCLGSGESLHPETIRIDPWVFESSTSVGFLGKKIHRERTPKDCIPLNAGQNLMLLQMERLQVRCATIVHEETCKKVCWEIL